MSLHDDILGRLRGQVDVMRHRPYPWGETAEFCPARVYASLCRSFPERGFRLCISEQGDKAYRMYTRDVGDDAPALPLPWQRLTACLRSDAYAASLSQVTGRSLLTLRRTLHLWRYARGCFLSPHVDKAEKLVTQIFYFNPTWARGWGASLQILNGREATDVHREVVPCGNRSAILVRTHDSWHAVSRQRAPKPLERRALQLVYYR